MVPDPSSTQTNGLPSAFSSLNLVKPLLDALNAEGYTTPTPIQTQAIPPALDGRDVLGIAQTGTGKTAAFALPILNQLIGKSTPATPLLHGRAPRALILAPTRELAAQIGESFAAYGRRTQIKCAVVYGGVGQRPQVNALRNGVDVLVATPGRLMDLMQQRLVDLRSISFVVLDEADRMLDMGFIDPIRRIMAAVPTKRQTMLFSATMPAEITKMAATHMRQPLRIEIAPQGTTAERVQQEMFMVRKEDKIRLLSHLLTEVHGSIIVFSRTRHGAKKITRDVRTMGHSAAEIHSDRSLGQRREALEGFRSGKYRVLVATDIAARGIDVKGIELVINFDLPDDAQDYVHRIGRTGRAGREGRAISFATPEQRADVRIIERLIRAAIPQGTLPQTLPPAPPRPAFEAPERREQPARGSRPAHRSYRSKGALQFAPPGTPTSSYASRRPPSAANSQYAQGSHGPRHGGRAPRGRR
ncbi:MAG: DEAD/DEAH box helicase [Planctomycetes bacterium]|nr:DEAD/DEAH box helicase [Planctomycetota bacterium]